MKTTKNKQIELNKNNRTLGKSLQIRIILLRGFGLAKHGLLSCPTQHVLGMIKGHAWLVEEGGGEFVK